MPACTSLLGEPWNVCCECPPTVTVGLGLLVSNPDGNCEAMLGGNFPSIPIDKNGDVQLYNGSDENPIEIPELREKYYSTWDSIVIKEADGTISAIKAPNDGKKYTLVAKNGIYFYEEIAAAAAVNVGEYDYVLPVADLADSVDFSVEWAALVAANPLKTIKIVRYFTNSDTATEASLGDAGIDFPNKIARYIGNKPTGESHALHITLGVYT